MYFSAAAKEVQLPEAIIVLFTLASLIQVWPAPSPFGVCLILYITTASAPHHQDQCIVCELAINVFLILILKTDQVYNVAKAMWKSTHIALVWLVSAMVIVVAP